MERDITVSATKSNSMINLKGPLVVGGGLFFTCGAAVMSAALVEKVTMLLELGICTGCNVSGSLGSHFVSGLFLLPGIGATRTHSTVHAAQALIDSILSCCSNPTPDTNYLLHRGRCSG